MKFIKINSILILLSLVIIACSASLKNYTKEKCTTVPSTAVVKVIQNNCVSCHKKDFISAKDICVRKTLIIDSVKNDRMPKFGSLSQQAKQTILNWK